MIVHEFDRYFYATICRVCSEHPICERGLSLLKTCSGCRLVPYCSLDHQKKHWPYHKSFCKALRVVLTKLNASKLYSGSLAGCHVRDWNVIRLNIHLLCQLELSRKLTASETQMLLFPRVCNVCLVPQTNILRDCRICLCVSYCSVEHQEKDRERHSKDCPALKLCLDLDTAHEACSYFTKNGSPTFRNIICADREKALGILFNLSFLSNENIRTFNEICESDILSCPMTVVFVAYHSLGNISNSLHVEIVGAGEYEISNFAKWEQLFHCFPHLKSVHLSFIGPEVPGECLLDLNLCELCVSREVQVTVDLHSGKLYSTFVKERRIKPDLMFAFNCGFAEFSGNSQDTWSESIPFMLEVGCPLAITSYNLQEATLDLKCVKQICKDVFVSMECSKNIFGSQRPHRDWEAHEYTCNSQVFYKNNILTIIESSSLGAPSE